MTKRILGACGRRLLAAWIVVAAGCGSAWANNGQRAGSEPFACEPTIHDVRRRAVAFAGATHDTVSALRVRMRLAPLLPHKFAVQVDKDMAVDRILSVSEDDSFTSKLDRDDGVGLRIQAEWDLAKLVYDPDELRLLSISLNQAELRLAIGSAATRRYLDRRRLQLKLATNESLPAAQRRQLRLKLAESTAELDSLTGGWFSKELKRRCR